MFGSRLQKRDRRRRRRCERNALLVLIAGVADAPMEAEPSAIEMAAQALRAPGTVRYWTDFLKVTCCVAVPAPYLIATAERIMPANRGRTSHRLFDNLCEHSVHRFATGWPHVTVTLAQSCS